MSLDHALTASPAVAFSRFETKDSTELLMPKFVFLFLQVVVMMLGVYKVNAMGLLPTTTSDWLAFLEPKKVTVTQRNGCALLILTHGTAVWWCLGPRIRRYLISIKYLYTPFPSICHAVTSFICLSVKRSNEASRFCTCCHLYCNVSSLQVFRPHKF